MADAINRPFLHKQRHNPEAHHGHPLRARNASASDGTVLASLDGLPPLESKWICADRAIRTAIKETRRAAQTRSGISRLAKLLLNQSTLLHRALRESRQGLMTARELSGKAADESNSAQRTYTIAERFLEESRSGFDKLELTRYLVALRGNPSLALSELWLLKPILLLVLLGRIAGAWKRGGPGQPARFGGNGNEPAEVEDLIDSLQQVMICDWEEVVSEASEIEAILREDPSGDYILMDAESRQMYRNIVADHAAHSRCDEATVARLAVRLARSPQADPNKRARERRAHVGFYLIDKGAKVLKDAIGYRPPAAIRVREAILNRPGLFYFSGIALAALAVMTAVLAACGVRTAGVTGRALLLLLGFECAVAIANLLATRLIPPRKLPRLDFSRGIPRDRATLVAIPLLLTSEAQVKQAVRDLEIRYLANCSANLHFALLTDPPDSRQARDEKDELAEVCSQLIWKLNERYARRRKGSFFLFHRHRTYCSSEGVWMGWERKRGKLLDLNRLLRNTGDHFSVKIGDLSVLPRIRYVITLDEDTQLPKDSALRLIGVMAHPLSRAVIHPATNTVVEGYGILQPRVEISSRSAARSRLAAILSGETGLDVYTRAVSDVYQDLFGEGIYTGKGIYEVETFQQVLENRLPSNSILSHDLIEGIFARTGLITDVEVIDDYPSHTSAYCRRKHRWIRGDWQLLRWLFPRVPDASGEMVRNPLSFVSRWKIVDNLRRSLSDAAAFALLLCGWLFLPGKPLYWTLATLALLCLPSFLQLALACLSAVSGGYSRTRWRTLADDATITGRRFLLRLTLLCDQSLLATDAVARALFRTFVTRKRLLQWEASALAERGGRPKDFIDRYLEATRWISLSLTFVLAAFRPDALAVAAPFLVAWGLSQPVSEWLDQPRGSTRAGIHAEEKTLLRHAALRTWRFFREFSNAEENWLIPDIVQESPRLVAHRLSPTNLGLLLNARIAAHDLGFLTLPEFIQATEGTFATLQRMPVCNGHFYNWYDTKTLEPVPPMFVSTVDSGNLVCSLWTLRQTCLEFPKRSLFGKALWKGIHDHLEIVEELFRSTESTDAALSIQELKSQARALVTSGWIRLDVLASLSAGVRALERRCSTSDAPDEVRWWMQELSLRIAAVQNMVQTLAPWLLPRYAEFCRMTGMAHALRIQDLTAGGVANMQADMLEKLRHIAASEVVSELTRAESQLLLSALSRSAAALYDLTDRMAHIAATADSLATKMDFGFLYVQERKALSIGYDAGAGRIHDAVYDLLASEARSASFVAIAKGEIPAESWMQLGRPCRPSKHGNLLLSWTGTMFEYLTPFLWMKCSPNTLLGHAARTAIQTQREFVAIQPIPWGISESSCKDRNPDGHYRYHAFGVPSLAVSHLSSQELVIAPYASFLALMVDMQAAMENIRLMYEMGWLGPYGFYEACDFTPAHPGAPNKGELVRNWMAHHQGMSLLAVANVLCDASMRRRFHSEPVVAAIERLLEEKPLRRLAPDSIADGQGDPLPFVPFGAQEVAASD